MDVMLLTGGMLGLAFMSDVTKQKIPNLLCAIGFLAGLVLQTVNSGTAGIGYALLGSLLGFVPLLILYGMRAVGAGDVKLFAAIGALTGAEIVLQSIMYSLLYAALIGCFILCWRREWKSRGGGAWKMLMHFVIWKQVEPLAAYRNSVYHLRFPFMWAVLPATATAFWQFS
ncbi:A24 family peptidase [Paenibacillus agricola]|uniref:Prepilin peptidase n=1 Tax=Paenibacillus agricola TaxID=2716264 RepID=A0ABX0J6C0_9BACL|nr:A24 family peptidase [Paenibacillus agricola]NHN30709.1 prepilin peptidase [Paenibacillus agricola]